MKYFLTASLLFSAFIGLSQVSSTSIFSKKNPVNNSNENSDRSSNRKINEDTLITLKLIFEMVSELNKKWDLQDSIVKIKYKDPLEYYKKLHEEDSVNNQKQIDKYRKLEDTKNELETFKSKNEKLLKEKTDFIEKQKNYIDAISLTINNQILSLQNSNYTLDSNIVNQLILVCNTFTEKSKIPNYSLLIEFKTKISAIRKSMNLLETVVLNTKQIELAKKELTEKFGEKNKNFPNLNLDYDLAMKLFDEYTNVFCLVSLNIDNVMNMSTYKDFQKKESLEGKCYTKSLDYPKIQSILADVIKSGFKNNPLKGKIDCE